jgi:hypothetical protein
MVKPLPILFLYLLTCQLGVSLAQQHGAAVGGALSQQNPSLVSALVLGSVVVGVSYAPIAASQSISNGKVGNVRAAGKDLTDIEVRANESAQPVAIRVPNESIRAAPPKTGQRADLIADANGHTLRIEDRAVVYVPGKNAEGLMYSKELK